MLYVPESIILQQKGKTKQILWSASYCRGMVYHDVTKHAGSFAALRGCKDWDRDTGRFYPLFLQQRNFLLFLQMATKVFFVVSAFSNKGFFRCFCM